MMKKMILTEWCSPAARWFHSVTRWLWQSIDTVTASRTPEHIIIPSSSSCDTWNCVKYKCAQNVPDFPVKSTSNWCKQNSFKDYVNVTVCPMSSLLTAWKSKVMATTYIIIHAYTDPGPSIQDQLMQFSKTNTFPFPFLSSITWLFAAYPQFPDFSRFSGPLLTQPPMTLLPYHLQCTNRWPSLSYHWQSH